MEWSEVKGGDLVAAMQRLLGAMGPHASDVVGRIKSDPDFVKFFARKMVNGDFDRPTPTDRAMQIMGSNFFGVAHVHLNFGSLVTNENGIVLFPKNAMAYIESIPWSEHTLRACRNSHVLIATCRVSIRDMWTQFRNNFGYEGWFKEKPFLREVCEVDWHLVRKVPITESIGLSFDEQQERIPMEERIVDAGVLIQCALGRQIVGNIGGSILSEYHWRTATLDKEARYPHDRIVIFYEEEKLRITTECGCSGKAGSKFVLATERKPFC